MPPSMSDMGENVVGWSFLPFVFVLWAVALVTYAIVSLVRRLRHAR